MRTPTGEHCWPVTQSCYCTRSNLGHGNSRAGTHFRTGPGPLRALRKTYVCSGQLMMHPETSGQVWAGGVLWGRETGVNVVRKILGNFDSSIKCPRRVFPF